MVLEFGGDGMIQVFGTDSYCDNGVDGETDSSSRVEEYNEMVLRFSGDGTIRVFGTDSCDGGADGETDCSSRVEKDDEMILGFDGVTTNCKKRGYW